MLFAVLGGPHGNAAALDAALADVAAQGIHSVLCTGNLAVGGDQPNGVIDRMRERRVTCVQGESDRLVVRALRKAASMKERLGDERFDAIARAHEALTSVNLEFLRALPRTRTLPVETVGLFLCHGTVSSQSDEIAEDESIERFRRQREAANTEIIVCGSDGNPFIKWIDQTLFVNPGSLDAGEHAAHYIMINTDAEPYRAEIRRV